MKTAIHGLEIEYSCAGNGPSLLILHGWARDSADWQGIANSLADSFRVWTIDLPGFGNSQNPPESWGLEEYAMLVDAFIKSQNISSVTFVAHSFGGRIALLIASQGPSYLQKLVLVAAAGIASKPTPAQRVIQVGMQAGKICLSVLPAGFRRKIEALFYDALRAKQVEYAMIPEMMSVFKRVVSKDLGPFLENIHTPTLLVWGENDDTVPLAHAKKMNEKIHGSALKIIPGAGHFPFIDKETEFVTILRTFLHA